MQREMDDFSDFLINIIIIIIIIVGVVVIAVVVIFNFCLSAKCNFNYYIFFRIFTYMHIYVNIFGMDKVI